MALIVEDGTNVAGADCYADVAALAAWEVLYFGTASTGDAALLEAGIRRATLFIDSLNLKGSPTNGRSQPRAWPRSSVSDIDGNAIDNDEVPREIIEAQHILSRVEIATPGILSPSVTPKDAKVLVEVKGVKWKSLASEGDIVASRPTVTMAMDRLVGFIDIDYSDQGIGFNSVGSFSNG